LSEDQKKIIFEKNELLEKLGDQKVFVCFSDDSALLCMENLKKKRKTTALRPKDWKIN